MTAVAKKETRIVERKEPEDPLLKKSIPHAYALVPIEGRPGMYCAVHLEGVTAERLEHLEPNGRPAQAPAGMLRIHGAMERRHLGKKWG